MIWKVAVTVASAQRSHHRTASLPVTTYALAFCVRRCPTWRACQPLQRRSEDELLDKLCEGGYDAIVYNPSGFQVSGLPDSGFRDAPPTAGVSSAAADPDAVVQAEGGEGNGSRQRFLRDGYQKRDGRGRAIEYGLARAGCPVVFVSPRDGTAPGTRMPAGKLGGGAISGFSGVVSYRLAMVAVASVLDDRR